MKILLSALSILGLLPAMVHAQLDYRLYGISLSTGEVLEINKSTGEATSLMNLGFIPVGADGFDFDPSGRVMLLSNKPSLADQAGFVAYERLSLDHHIQGKRVIRR